MDGARLILFDIDGTLTQSRQGHIPFNRAIRAAFGADGDIRGVIPDGKTDPFILEEIFARAGHATDVGADNWRRFAARRSWSLFRGSNRCWRL